MQRFIDFTIKKIRDKQVRIKREKSRNSISTVAFFKFYPRLSFFSGLPSSNFPRDEGRSGGAFWVGLLPPWRPPRTFFFFFVQFIYTWTCNFKLKIKNTPLKGGVVVKKKKRERG